MLPRFSVVVIVAAGFLGGCAFPRQEPAVVTRAEVDQLSQSQEELQRLLHEMSRDVSEQSRLLQEIRADSNARLGEITARLDRVRYMLEGQGEQLERWQGELRTRTAAPAFPEKKELATLSVLTDSVTAAPVHPRSEDSPQAREAYTAAYEDFTRGNYEQAIMRFRVFLREYPNHPLADDAQYLLGECFYARDELDQAVLEYLQVRALYPNGDQVAAATLKAGYVFLRQGDVERARGYLEQVSREFPGSKEAGLAREKLSRIP